MEWGGSGAPGLLYLRFHTVSLLAKSHSPSAEACPAGVDFLGQVGRVSAALPAGLAAEVGEPQCVLWNPWGIHWAVPVCTVQVNPQKYELLKY